MGQGENRELPLVADLRSVELSDHPLVASLRQRTGAIAQEALRLSRGLTEALPDELSARPAQDLPSLWECFAHEFARHSLAPALMNLEIARAALSEGPVGVQLVERRGPRWWLGGSGAAEAVREAVREYPGASLPGPSAATLLRNHLLPWLSRRAPRFVDECACCEPLDNERLGTETYEVLFLGVAATTAPIIAHLTEALEGRGLGCATVDMHYEASTAALRQTGVRLIDGWPGGYPGGREARWALRRHYGRLRHETAGGVRKLVESGGIPPWLGPVTTMRLTVALARDLPVLAEYRVAADQILATLRPRLVVGFHLSPDFLAPLLLAARLRGIPTVCCQHGIRGPVHRNGVALPWDLLPAWGQYTVDLYEGMIETHSRWVVTGNCLYDDLVNRAQVTPALPGDTPIVLAATQSDEAQVKRTQRRWWLQGVAAACRDLQARLVIKTHPAETSAALYRDVTAAFPETTQVLGPTQATLREVLVQAEVLVTRDSTAVYEAALAGKPALAVTLPPYRPRFPLAEHGGAIGVAAYDGIEPALRDALRKGPATQELERRRPQFLNYHLGPQDGHATDRLLAALQEAMREVGTPDVDPA